MTISNYHLVSPNPEKDLLPIAQLAAEVFTEGKHVEQFHQNYIGNSHYDCSTARLVWDGDKIVHHWGVWGYAMRVETAKLKVAGVGAVATLEPYRKQGLMHRAAQASFEAMRQSGYDLSVLRGRHYAKIGYARAWNYVTYYLKPEELLVKEAPQPYQPLAPGRVPEMDALYNRMYAHFPGTAVRPTYRNRCPQDIGVYDWFDGQGNLDGYLRALPDDDDPQTLQCLESAGDPLQALAVLCELFRDGNYQKLACFTLPYAHPLAQLLRKGACIVEDRYFDVSGWRVRLVNLHGTLENLVPLFEQRLAQSQFAGWQGTLHLDGGALDGGRHQAALQIRRGKVEITQDGAGEHVLHGGADIARLLIGSDEPGEIIRQAEMDCQGLAAPLALVLFPNLHPMLSHWDEY